MWVCLAKIKWLIYYNIIEFLECIAANVNVSSSSVYDETEYREKSEQEILRDKVIQW